MFPRKLVTFAGHLVMYGLANEELLEERDI